MNKILGETIGLWGVFSVARNTFEDPNPIYNCQCQKCGISHMVSETNILAHIPCPTCPTPKESPKSPLQDVVNIFGGIMGMDAAKKTEVNSALNKLNQPEFKEVYSSLERASKSIKDVMNGNLGSSDVARKVLEMEAGNLKKAFNGLVQDGKITEEEARILKTEVNSSANMQKLKSVLETMKQQHRETKKAKI